MRLYALFTAEQESGRELGLAKEIAVTPGPVKNTFEVPHLAAPSLNGSMSDRQIQQVEPAAELEKIYSRRFNSHITYRNQVWNVLANRFFARYISPEAALLDLGCGYTESSSTTSPAGKRSLRWI